MDFSNIPPSPSLYRIFIRLPNLNQEGINNLNRPITDERIETVTKILPA